MYDNEWGAICDSEWDLRDGDVVCRQLGCSQAETVINSKVTHNTYGSGTSVIHMTDVDCKGDESHLFECEHPGFGRYYPCGRYAQDWVATVKCTGCLRLWDNLGTIRAPQGRVEVLWEEEWGTMCDDHFREQDGLVICRQLGCTGVEEILYDGLHEFGMGSGKTWLNRIMCEGHENLITDCPYIDFSDNGLLQKCDHVDDVALRCSGNIKDIRFE